MSYLTCTDAFQEMKCYPHFPNSFWKKTLYDTSGCLSSSSIIWKWQSRLPSKLFSAAHNFFVSPPNHPFLLKNFILCTLVSSHFSYIEIASFRSKSCLKMFCLQLRLFNKTIWYSETKKGSSFPSGCLVAEDTIKVEDGWAMFSPLWTRDVYSPCSPSTEGQNWASCIHSTFTAHLCARSHAGRSLHGKADMCTHK